MYQKATPLLVNILRGMQIVFAIRELIIKTFLISFGVTNERGWNFLNHQLTENFKPLFLGSESNAISVREKQGALIVAIYLPIKTSRSTPS